MVSELSERAWSLSGSPLPDYVRSEIPIRRIRVGNEADEEPTAS
jgi:hypothetical protein